MEQNKSQSDFSASNDMPTPILPLRDVVVYPHMVIPLFVGRDKSIHALDIAMKSGKSILLVAQKSAEVDDPQEDDIYRMGTLSNVLQLLKLPDGTVKVLVEGNQRAEIERFTETEACFLAHITLLETTSQAPDKQTQVLMRSVLSIFDQYVKLNKKYRLRC